MNSDAVVTTEPASEVVDPRRTTLGRVLDGNEGVREWRTSILVAREMGWTSETPFRNANVLTCTDLPRVSRVILRGAISPVTALCCDIFVERIPGDSLYVVRVLSQCENTFTCGRQQHPSGKHPYAPVEAFHMVAVLSVDPAMKNSPSGLQARSYTCFVVTLPH